jgi:hypothetical protein
MYLTLSRLGLAPRLMCKCVTCTRLLRHLQAVQLQQLAWPCGHLGATSWLVVAGPERLNIWLIFSFCTH